MAIASGPFGETEHITLSRELTWLRPGDSQRVGRSGYKSDMVIPSDQRMSSGHFVVTCEEDGCYVSDMESTNGTFVNGQRIESLTRLHDGDEIKAGSTTFSVQIIDSARSNSSLEIERIAADAFAGESAAGGQARGSETTDFPQFAIETVSGPGTTIELKETETLNEGWMRPGTIIKIGSSAWEADYVIDGDSGVASEHITLQQQEAVVRLAVLKDCPSVKVNNITVRDAELSGGERITIGETVLLLRAIQRHNAPPSQVPPKDPSIAAAADDADVARHITALSSGHREQVLSSLEWFNTATPNEALRDKACQKIATFARSSDQLLRQLAATAFSKWTTEKGKITLLQFLSGNDPIVVQAAVEGLLKIGDPKCAEAIAGVLKDSARRAAVFNAVESQQGKAETVAIRLLLHADNQIQIEACRILEAVGGKQGEVALQAKLQRLSGGDNDSVRAAAQQALDAVRTR